MSRVVFKGRFDIIRSAAARNQILASLVYNDRPGDYWNRRLHHRGCYYPKAFSRTRDIRDNGCVVSALPMDLQIDEGNHSCDGKLLGHVSDEPMVVEEWQSSLEESK